jgi:hypothetical protein
MCSEGREDVEDKLPDENLEKVKTLVRKIVV